MKKAPTRNEKAVAEGKNKEIAKNPKPAIQQNGEAQPAKRDQKSIKGSK
jgi:hypothetical protein